MPFPAGHFYSPVIDAADLEKRKDALWPRVLPDLVGVDLKYESQRQTLRALSRFGQEYDYPKTKPEDAPDFAFFESNGLFQGLDSRLLFCILREHQPSRLVEVGSGFSSLLAADVNRRFLNGQTRITCIEPFPRPFLVDGVPGISEVIQNRVELVGLDPFEELEAGDVLFIDSSHVVKTGNDVVFLYLEVLPRLKPGVMVHIHDIFFPRDYPAKWVLDEERSWSEQYLLQALLMFSRGFEVMLSSSCLWYTCPEFVRECFGGSYHGGSFWMKRV